MDLLFIALAPILQIVLSVLRIAGKIKIPIGVIAVLAIITGGFCSFSAGNWAMNELIAQSPKGHMTCGMPFVAFFIGGTLVDFTAAFIIGGICAIIYYQITKKREATSLA